MKRQTLELNWDGSRSLRQLVIRAPLLGEILEIREVSNAGMVDTWTSISRDTLILPLSLKERRKMVGKFVREDLIRLGFDLLDDQDKKLSLDSLDQTDERGLEPPMTGKYHLE